MAYALTLTASENTGHRLTRFDEPKLVFRADPAPSEPLQTAHAAIHQLIDPALCHPHYQPGNWVAHATVAMEVEARHKSAAIDFASQEIEPFDVVFDKADCLEFHPIRVFETQALSGDQ